ncbi:STAS domain-containing protein [Dactylosporangium sp. AC04546]|uniref:STAS domain-containing protein n=1 Tax=Dactylosporangium sp. AC04546 TaxID=2862460 RepID=UPI001EDED7ED|nr:STAS domain-containing protein [Dactylosporangium sp. AC04546]WVK87842.1 STAS domain-containing protein [Dactylosporangium sp. AC04546]
MTAVSLSLDGELTVINAAEQHERLLRALDGSRLDVSLAGVTDLDTAGLQVLLFLSREAARRSVPVSFAGHSPAVLEVLRLVGLSPSLEVDT